MFENLVYFVARCVLPQKGYWRGYLTVFSYPPEESLVTLFRYRLGIESLELELRRNQIPYYKEVESPF